MVAWELRHAPEGYEDASGFHALPRSNRPANVPSAGINPRPRPTGRKIGGHVARHA